MPEAEPEAVPEVVEEEHPAPVYDEFLDIERNERAPVDYIQDNEPNPWDLNEGYKDFLGQA